MRQRFLSIGNRIFNMRQEVTESSESRIMKLPDDLIFEIFFRLECRDILSCRGVCKTWYNLISDPNFSSNYTRYSPFLTFFSLGHHANYDCLRLFHFAANGKFIKRSIKTKVTRYSQSSQSFSFVQVIGSCNGLLFYVLHHYESYKRFQIETFYFCNPLFRGYFALGEFRRENYRGKHEYYKLGFVPSSNKIKLLRFVFDDHRVLQEAHILTFREDAEWRKLNDPLMYLFYLSRNDGTCFHGVYHWVAFNRYVDWICTFDYQEEKCGQMSKPPGLLQLSSIMAITVLNNNLCLIEHSDPCHGITIWTMKEYGVAESWSKDILLLSWYPVISPCYLVNLLPLAVLSNGESIFSTYPNSLLFISPENKQHEFVYASNMSAFAPRFYALEEDEEDVGGRKGRGTRSVWLCALFCVLLLAVMLSPLFVN